MPNVIEAMWAGLVGVLSWPAFGYLLISILVGFWVGILPGLGGRATLAIMIPFTFGLQPIEAFCFLLAAHAVNSTTGDITSVLFGVPGEAVSAAVILDGHPMAKKGEAGRALGAVLFSSLIGAILGAIVLAVSVPFVRPFILNFTAAELFALIVLGLTFVGSLSGRFWRRGLLMAGFGLVLSMIGMDPHTSIPRYTFGLPYLWDGAPLIPVAIGLFAIPEIIDLAVSGSRVSEERVRISGGVLEGIFDTFRHWGLVLRCSMIGTFIGFIPGLGGGTAQWLAYAHSIHSGKTPAEREGFGKGDVRGVLGPGAANNSKEGGELIPTIAFGVPGSGSMAILLGAFMIIGVIPGPKMLSEHLHVTFAMVWIIVISNIITVIACLLFLKQLASLAYIRSSILIPVILFLIFIGAFGATNNFADIVVMVISGVAGYAMVLLRWPRPPLVLGLVLGNLAENYLYISLGAFGAWFLLRPLVIVILSVAVGVVVYSVMQRRNAFAIDEAD
ncbi:MAG: tripartite tricarboxylate transporter permease [Deltaproteobacteria bacterium]|nr:tripartite tricarboxylate transporter permease [Deltaproteobacteria bacterium]